MSQPILLAIIAVMGSVIVGGTTGLVTWLLGNRKNKTDERTADGNLAHQLRDELRSDRDAARKERDDIRADAERRNNELTGKIEELTIKVEGLKTEIQGHETRTETAEKTAKEALIRAENAFAEAEGWKLRYQNEHEAVNALSVMYEAATSLRPPDVVMIRLAEETLRKLGLLTTPPKPAASPENNL